MALGLGSSHALRKVMFNDEVVWKVDVAPACIVGRRLAPTVQH